MSTPLEAQGARGGGCTCGHALVGKDVVRPGDDENGKSQRLERRRITDQVSMQQGDSILIAEPLSASPYIAGPAYWAIMALSLIHI